MPRARNIKPGFFKNEELAECSLGARLCFAGLWMLADREGRLEDRPKRIKGELFPFDSFDVEPLLAELAQHRFIERYEIDGARFIEISKFSTHQTPHYSEKKSVIKPPRFQERRSDEGVAPSGELQESESDEDRPAPGTLPENSGKEGSIKRGSQPPDSLNPDSLIPDSPNPEEDPAAGAAAAGPPTAPEPKALTARERLWVLGIALLGESKRSLLGKLAKAHGEEVLAQVLAEATVDKPVDPGPWVIAACETRSKAKPTEEIEPDIRDNAAVMAANPKPKWALDAGFESRFEAYNERCFATNAHLFRDGQRIQ